MCYGTSMEHKETKERNSIRASINRYDLLGDPVDLVVAQELIHRELLNITTLHNSKLWYTKRKNVHEKN